MIYISPDEVKASIPADWFAKAEQARKDIEARSDPTARSAAIDAHDAIWQSLQHSLSKLRNDKCWYCECSDARCDRPVDHFRPKSAVVEDERHEGYWWLAFAWENFRYCCQFCNERRVDKRHGTAGGKSHHFPIWTDGVRASKDGDSLEDEKAMLLDPCCRTDPPFLWFDEHGQPAANPLTCGPKDSFPSQRVDVSIHCYHLDHFKVVDRRQVLYQTIKRKVGDAEHMLRRYQQRADPAAQRSLANSICEIRELLSPKAPLSRTAECALMSLRATHVVADIALTGTR